MSMRSLGVIPVAWFALLTGFLAVLVPLAASQGACSFNGEQAADGLRTYTWSSPNFGGVGDGTYSPATSCDHRLTTPDSPNYQPQKYLVTLVKKTITAEECSNLGSFKIYGAWFYDDINLCEKAQGDSFYLAIGGVFDFKFDADGNQGTGEFQVTIADVDDPGCHVYAEIGGAGKKSLWFKSPKKGGLEKPYNKQYKKNYQCEVFVKTVNDKKQCVQFRGESKMMGPAICKTRDGSEADEMKCTSPFDGMAVSIDGGRQPPTNADDMVCGRRKFQFTSTGVTMRMIWATDPVKNSVTRRGLKGKFVAVRCPAGRRRRRSTPSAPICVLPESN